MDKQDFWDTCKHEERLFALFVAAKLKGRAITVDDKKTMRRWYFKSDGRSPFSYPADVLVTWGKYFEYKTSS